MRRTSLLLALGAALAPVLVACDVTADDRPLVVVTTNILGDVVENLAGDEAEVVTLMRPDADPHSFQISARQSHEMRQADLLVSNGLGLEEGLEQHLDAASGDGVRQVVAGDVIDVLRDGSGRPDPHFWTDPARMVAVAEALTEALTRIDGVDPATVRSNAAAYREDLTELDAEMTATFAALPADRRVLVTNHHVFGYLAGRFDFEIVGAVIPGGTTLAAPSASDLRDLTAAIERADVPTIFAESSQPDRLIQVLADEAAVRVEVVELFTESLTAPGGGADTYLTLMRVNTDRIATGLAP